MADNTTRPYLVVTHPVKDGAYGLYDEDNYIRFKAYGINISEVSSCKIELKNVCLYAREKGTSTWTLVKSGDIYSPPTISKWDSEIFKDAYSSYYGIYALNSIPNYKFFTEYEYYIQADYVFTYDATTTEQQNSVNNGLTTLGIVTKIDNSKYKYTLKSHVRKFALTPPTAYRKGSLRSRVSSSDTEVYPAFKYEPKNDVGKNPTISLDINNEVVHVPTVSSGNVFAGRTKIQMNSGTKHLAKQSSNVYIQDSGIAWSSYGEQYRKYTQSYQEAVPSSYANGSYHYTQPSQEYRYNYYGYNTVSNKTYVRGTSNYQYYNTDKSYSGNYNTTLTNTYYVIDSYKIGSYYYTYDKKYEYEYSYVSRYTTTEEKHYKITGYNTIVDTYKTITNYTYYRYNYVSGSHVSGYFYYNKEPQYAWHYIQYEYVGGYYYKSMGTGYRKKTLGGFPLKTYKYRYSIHQYSYRIMYYNSWPLYVFQHYAIDQLGVYSGTYQLYTYNNTFYVHSSNYDNVLWYNESYSYPIYGTAYVYNYKATDTYITGYTADRGTNYALDYSTKYDKTMVSGYTNLPDRVHYTTNYGYDYSSYYYGKTWSVAYSTAYNGQRSNPRYEIDRTHRVDVYRQDLRQLTGYSYYYYWNNTYFYTQPQYYVQNATAYKYYNNPVANYSYRYGSYQYNSSKPTRYQQYYRYLTAREF